MDIKATGPRLRRSGICFALFLPLLTGLSSEIVYGAATVMDTVYTPPGYPGGALHALVYIPETPNGAGVVLTHGITTNKYSLTFWCDSLAAHGYVAMTIDYFDINLVSGRYPKPVRAFKTATQFLRRNAARFGIEPTKIAGLGVSQGALVWGQAMIWDNDFAFFGTDSTIDDRLNAAVLLYGLYNNASNLGSTIDVNGILHTYFTDNRSYRNTKGSCINNVTRITTPVLMFHGTADAIIQYQQSVELNDSLLAKGKSSRLELPAGEPHVFDRNGTGDGFSAAGLGAKDTVIAFLARSLNIEPVARGR